MADCLSGNCFSKEIGQNQEVKHILIFKTGFSNINQEFCLPPPYTALTYALNFILKRKPFVQRLCCLKLKLFLELCRFFSRFKIGKLLVSTLFTIKWHKNFMKLIFLNKNDDVIIWDPGVTSELLPTIFET